MSDFLSMYVNDVNIVNCVGNVSNVNNDSVNVFEPQSELVENVRTAQKSDIKCTEIADKVDKDEKFSPAYLRFYLNGYLLVCKVTRDAPLLENVRKLVVTLELVPESLKLTDDSWAGYHKGYHNTIK